VLLEASAVYIAIEIPHGPIVETLLERGFNVYAINANTLLAEGWEALRRSDYHALWTLCGAAPITKRSGKSCIVTRRLEMLRGVMDPQW
jgi:hypothetical protein